MESRGLSRRQFLRSGMYGGIGFFFAEALGGGTAFAWPIKQEGFGSIVKVPKKLSEIQVGDVLKVREGKFYLTRTADGLMALYWRCVHLGCTVPWVPELGLFKCPCHQSIYEITGQNIAGPAPRPLDYMEVRVEGDEIFVNSGKISTRTSYDPSQALKV